MIAHAGGEFDEQGNLSDEKTIEFLDKALISLINLSNQLNK